MFYFNFITLIIPSLLATSALSITPSMPSIKSAATLVLVDRDGVINVDVGSPGVLDPSELKLTTSAGFALGRLRRAGCNVALITNQSCVGKGLITENDLHGIHNKLQEMLLCQDQDARFDEIFYCTSRNDTYDHRRKPNPGMVEEALSQFLGDSVACVGKNVFFVGDTLTDLEAASRAGVPTRILVETGYGRGIMGGEEAPDVDGKVKIVNGEESNIEATTTANPSDDDNVSSKPSILPFLYAKNFCSAVEWILKSSSDA